MTSRKVIISLTILSLLLIGVGIYTSHMLNSSARRIEMHLNTMEANIKTGNWDKVKAELASTEKTWASTQKSWAVLIDHIEIDNIDDALSRMSRYIDSKDKALTLGESASLIQYVKHIPEKESFSLKNIL